VYDVISSKPFSARNIWLKLFCPRSPYIELVATTLIAKESCFLFLEQCIRAGYEGAIIRNPDGIYEKNRRSPHLQKLKKFESGEYLVKDIVAATTGREKDCAIFVCHSPEGEFRARPKMTLKHRRDIYLEKWRYRNWWAKIEYQGTTVNGLPRQPIAIAFAPRNDFC
jgi:hypothetical protein